MSEYYVNRTAQPNGDQEVHEEGCYWLGLAIDTSYLGRFSSCAPAVAAAILRGYNANGCKICSLDCHTS